MRAAVVLLLATPTACYQTTSIPLPVLEAETRAAVLVAISEHERPAIHALAIGRAARRSKKQRKRPRSCRSRSRFRC